MGSVYCLERGAQREESGVISTLYVDRKIVMILDATCGPKGMYRGRWKNFVEGEDIVFLDKRRGGWVAWRMMDIRKRMIKEKKHPGGLSGVCGTINPTVQGDFTQSPFRSGVFDFAVFDPPYESGGAGGLVVEKYGSLADGMEARRMLHNASKEFARLGIPYVLVSLNDSQYHMTTLFTAYMKKFGFRLLLTIDQKGVFNDSRVTAGHGQTWMVFVG